MRDWLAIQCLRLAARLTRWGDPYDKIMEALEMQRRYAGSE
ncbi:hypothetical protein [Aurantimonas coralicida]|nr:hypothetical protein [Aurantimonas coralicida]